MSSINLRYLYGAVADPQTTVGITVPKLLPITGTFVPFFALYQCLLAVRVSLHRIDSKTSLGDKAPEATGSKDSGELFVASRAHANFIENVPVAILIGAIVEMNGGNRRSLTAGFVALLLARIAHVELGLRGENNNGVGRKAGHLTTMSFIAGMSGYAAWLVRGYWGF